MDHRRKAISDQAKRLIGQPVCVELRNGSYYVGRVVGIEKGKLVLSGKKGRGILRRTVTQRNSKASVSGLFPGFDSLMGSPVGAGTANPVAAESPEVMNGFFGGLGGLSGMMGFINKAMPMVRMGIGVVKAIMPLLGGLKA